ncbi:MAG: hypothetical protein HY554_03790 [Elusimicrobia bacterium]|nr:hypothetical protein [Elusimicrobiota bacterium]
MKGPGLRLRTQLLLVVAFVELYTVGMGLSYWVQAHAQERLEQAFREDLAVLTKLPQLRDELRVLDEATDRYLLEGSARWLEQRRATLAAIRDSIRAIGSILEAQPEGERLVELEQGLAAYLAQQEQWIALRQSGRLPNADAVRLSRQSHPFERLAAGVTGLKDVSVQHLRERRAIVRQATLVALGFVLVTGLIASLLLAVFLSRYMIKPILELEGFARSWQLGQPWTVEAKQAGPEVEGLIHRMREMSERLNRQFRRERELGELKTQLVSMVSHEFNNAMTVIVGVTALLEDSEGERGEDRGRYYEMIKDNVRALTLASTNLLNMGRLESGRFAVSPRRVEVRGLLGETAERLQVLWRRKRQSVALELPELTLPVRADPEALTLVITNLLSNAVKYTPEGGSVTLGLHRPGDEPDCVEVFCRDTGIGISAEDRERVLAGYYRTESGKRTAKGFGVGLALANSLIEAHGSRLAIASAQGKGSTFSFRLPLWREPASAPSAVAARPS